MTSIDDHNKPTAMRDETATPPDPLSAEMYRKTADFYTKLIQTSPDAIFIYVDEKIVFANRSAIEILGAQHEHQVLGKAVFDFVPRESHERLRKGIWKIIHDRDAHLTTDDKIIRLDGTIIDIEISSSFFSYDGANGVLAFLRNSTKRKAAEARLRESENKYRTIFETTGTAMIFIENDTTISLINHESEKMCGLQKSDVEGKMSWTEFVADADLPRLLKAHELRRIDESTVPRNHEFRFHDRGGNFRNVYLTVSLIPETNQSVASLIDITDIRRAEGALAASEARYRLLAENARDIIIAYKLDGNITYINNAGCGVIGKSRDEILSMRVTDLIQSNKNHILHRALMGKKIDENRVYFNKAQITGSDGTTVQLETISNLIKVDNDSREVLVIARDITERKKLEREIINISERIRLQVGRDLHDDLSPHLIGIEALAEVLKIKLEDKSAPESYDAEKIKYLINEAITKTRRLIQGLCPVDIDSKGLTSALYNLSKRISSLYGIRCVFSCDNYTAIQDNILATSLYYIAQEATYNAVKHARARNIVITLYPDNDGNYTLKVEDDGIGIPLASSSSKGMGLQIMRYRAEIINSSFEIKKKKTGGTVVSCFIPDTYFKKDTGDNQ